MGQLIYERNRPIDWKLVVFCCALSNSFSRTYKLLVITELVGLPIKHADERSVNVAESAKH